MVHLQIIRADLIKTRRLCTVHTGDLRTNCVIVLVLFSDVSAKRYFHTETKLSHPTFSFNIILTNKGSSSQHSVYNESSTLPENEINTSTQRGWYMCSCRR